MKQTIKLSITTSLLLIANTFRNNFVQHTLYEVIRFYSSKVFSYKEKLNFFGDEIFNNMVQSNVYLGTTLTYDFNLVWSYNFV